MLSLMEIQCPHCGAKGQMVVPPMGAIVIGPCPTCQGLLMVFCGQVLPLDRDLMAHGTRREKHAHLMTVLTGFLNERIADLVQQTTPDQDGEAGDETSIDDDDLVVEASSIETNEANQRISQLEFDQFVEVDLKLLDNKAYFEAVFGKSS